MRIAVFGGAFNPPHVGHAMVLSWILMTGQADMVILVPSADHPFGKLLPPLDSRIEWLLAFIDDVGFRDRVAVSDIERHMPAPNYSINMLRAIRLACAVNDVEIRFVVGADNVAARSAWHAFDEIEREFNPIFVKRAGYPTDVPILSPDFPDMSSTDIRRRLAVGEPVNHLLTQSVCRLVTSPSCARGES